MNFNNILKMLVFTSLFFTFLVFITNFAESLIILLLNFTIGLRESFVSLTRIGKLYLANLYIVLIYIFIMRKEISNNIYRFFENFKENKLNIQHRESIEKYKSVLLFLGVYISICLIGLKFYNLNGNDWNKNNKADIINIFIWATYLITPIVAIWVFSDWRIQKKYEVNKDTCLNLLTVILELENCLEELMAITTEFRYLKNGDELNFFGRKCDELSLRFYDLINKLKSNNNLHHGLVRGFKGDKIITLEMLNKIDSFFQSLCDMVFDINDNYISGIKLKNIADEFLKDTIKAVGENQILYRDSFSPIKELLSSECQPHKKAP
ncbi:hypothetical protein [Acinetobacter terrae]|uniref:hypothetical protein n=1 Tax=Acinetobacter terrae TaxID=2731247 RepID=UPI001177F134|nr:hypothetical protein [Acinetobacter terrae]